MMTRSGLGVTGAVFALTMVLALTSFAAAPQNTRVLLGVWKGVATGPQGGPPTGDITVTFVKDAAAGVSGKIAVAAKGGFQYTGQISRMTLVKKLFSATVVFKLGENPLEVVVAGPLQGNSIQGKFTVNSKDQKLGEGTFSIKKEPRSVR